MFASILVISIDLDNAMKLLLLREFMIYHYPESLYLLIHYLLFTFFNFFSFFRHMHMRGVVFIPYFPYDKFYGNKTKTFFYGSCASSFWRFFESTVASGGFLDLHWRDAYKKPGNLYKSFSASFIDYFKRKETKGENAEIHIRTGVVYANTQLFTFYPLIGDSVGSQLYELESMKTHLGKRSAI